MNRLALLALLALSACGQPDRLVIDDDPELVDATMGALVDLEHEAGCKLFRRVVVGGRSKDWRRKYPPHGTVTIEVDPDDLLENKDGVSRMSHAQTRARISVIGADVRKSVIAHELLHALRMEHQDVKGELMSEVPRWDFSPDLLEQIQARCVDGPAGP